MEKLNSSCRCSKELQIGKPISMQAKFIRFISDTFSWKRMGLAEVGVKGIGVGGKSQGQHWVLCPEDLHSWLDGVKKLHIDWWVKGMPASLRGM